MASQFYEQAMNNPQPMSVTSPDGRVYDGYYCDPKLDRNTLPDGWHAYDIRHDDDGCGIFVTLNSDYVLCNSAGTFFTQTAIPELNGPGKSITFAIDPEEWSMAHEDPNEPCPENDPSDWGWTFN